MAIHKDDIGTVFEITLSDDNGVFNLSGATLKQLRLKNPNGVVTTKTATFSTNGTDGKLRYVTVAGDLPIEGPWSIEAYVEIGTGTRFHTNSASFTVSDNL